MTNYPSAPRPLNDTISGRHGRSRAVSFGTFLRSAASKLAARFAFMVTCCALTFGSACKAPQASGPSDPLPPRTPVSLTVGDVVKLSFPATPELNTAQKIRVDGKINAPMIGEVDAAGKRLGTFQDELAVLYKPHLKNNEVIVTLESSPVPVYVSGAVSKPGKIILDRPMTVLEAIMEAGGFGPMANMRKVRVIRLTKGQHHTQIVDLNPAMTGQPTKAFYVRADDVIYVPERAVNF